MAMRGGGEPVTLQLTGIRHCSYCGVSGKLRQVDFSPTLAARHNRVLKSGLPPIAMSMFVVRLVLQTNASLDLQLTNSYLNSKAFL